MKSALITFEDKIKRVNEILKNGEPHNIEVDTSRGFTLTGYKPQYIIDAMNQVFDIALWKFEKISSSINKIDSDQRVAVAEYQVTIITDGIEVSRTAFGSHTVKKDRLGDALKSAQTDSIKKALSYFSIGNRAYHGKLSK